MKRIISCMIMLSMVLLVSSCGKVSKPIPIEGSGYPHNYPRR